MLVECREWPDEGRIDFNCAYDPTPPPWATPSPAPSPAPSPTPTQKKRSVWPWVIGGAGVLGVGYLAYKYLV